MATTSPPGDISMTDRQTPPPIPSSAEEPKYGGFTRFEVELEVPIPSPLSSSHTHSLNYNPQLTPPQFVQSLSSPLYLNHLASLKYLENPAFIAYLSYLQYWSQPEYAKYLMYPGPTLKNLELLQQERFRADVLGPDVVGLLMEEGVRGAGEWHGS
jgi:mediator of RNA polymerase II transcription subunit 31